MLPESFQNSVNQEHSAGPVLWEYRLQQYYPSQTFQLFQLTQNYSWYTGCLDDPNMFLITPKQEERVIGSVKLSQFMVRPIRLLVRHRLISPMIRYKFSRARKNWEASFRVSRYLPIQWNMPDNWCGPMYSYFFDYLLFFQLDFQERGKQRITKKVPRDTPATEIRFKGRAAQKIKIYLVILWDNPDVWCVPMHPDVCD